MTFPWFCALLMLDLSGLAAVSITFAWKSRQEARFYEEHYELLLERYKALVLTSLVESSAHSQVARDAASIMLAMRETPGRMH